MFWDPRAGAVAKGYCFDVGHLDHPSLNLNPDGQRWLKGLLEDQTNLHARVLDIIQLLAVCEGVGPRGSSTLCTDELMDTCKGTLRQLASTLRSKYPSKLKGLNLDLITQESDLDDDEDDLDDPWEEGEL